MNQKPFILGVCGGTASGKSQACKKLQEELLSLITGRLKYSSERDTNGNEFPLRPQQSTPMQSLNEKELSQRIVILQQESFYKDLDEHGICLANSSLYNFDHPDAIDFELMERKLEELRAGRSVEVSVYDKRHNERGRAGTRVVGPAYLVIVYGNLIFFEARIRALFDMRIFVDCDADTRLARRVVRDVEQLGRPLEQVITHYLEIVKPSFEQFTLPFKKHANVIIPRGGENSAAISVIAQQIFKYLEENCGLTGVEGGRCLNAARALEAGDGSSAVAERHPPPIAIHQQQQPLLARSLSTGVPPTSPSELRGLTLTTYSADEDGAAAAFVTGVPTPHTPGGSTIFVDPIGARSPPHPAARTGERSTSGGNGVGPLASPPGACDSSRQRNVSESCSLNLTRPH